MVSTRAEFARYLDLDIYINIIHWTCNATYEPVKVHEAVLPTVVT